MLVPLSSSFHFHIQRRRHCDITFGCAFDNMCPSGSARTFCTDVGQRIVESPDVSPVSLSGTALGNVACIHGLLQRVLRVMKRYVILTSGEYFALCIACLIGCDFDFFNCARIDSLCLGSSPALITASTQ